MSNQGGLKHVATEPTRLESKRERRRGAAGRAAALRRAPSDSDCSGETASLSADSGDRAIRPAPQPPPRGKSRRNRAKRPAPPPPSSGKSRSRRRGSEWEVLEGLKDGQRFDKRPEVFNGYLHKKRKWPLKGWHKRFFVVDGGILVYARSPTDVARGRLHGSVDVGLSVISAKARRRRIDIDADEFIYHLRAKTPDVFRTWLTVLKAHRLYRQHLLTFGARESVPKIHAPLEDLPQTDTSSRATQSSIEITTLSSLHKIQNLTLPLTYVPSTTPVVPFDLNSPVYENKSQIPMINWPCVNRSSTLLPLKFDELSNDGLESIWPYKNDGQRSFNSVDLSLSPADISPISKETSNKSPFSLQTTDAEKQMHSTDLEWNLMSPDIKLSLCEYYSYTINKDQPMSVREQNQSSSFETEPVIGNDRTVSLPNKVEPIVTYCFSTHKTRQDVNPSPMKRSRKSTNLVKYRNVSSEPPLKRPFNNTLLLLGNYSTKLTKESRNVKKCDNSTICNIVSQSNIEIQAEVEDKGNKTANVISTSELDRITEKLMMSIFEKMENSCDSKNINIKSCINQVVKELYDSKVTSNDTHPVIALFKCLLEYWLKNTSLSSVREAVRRAKSIDRQSNKHFTKDENTSSDNIENINKQTQFHGMSDIVNKNISKMLIDIINKKGRHKPRGLRIHNDNSEKERQIQELERILKNTVYVCETSRGRSIEKDIKITKTLINNLDNMSQKCVRKQSNNNANLDNTNSSSELVKIQATINHLISETSLPLAVAKDFLNAYLGLLNNGSYSSSESPDKSKSDTIPKGDVQTESIQKKTSIGITTKETTEIDPRKPSNQNVDPGQLYLKSILDHITSIFCKSDQHFKIQCNAKEKDSNCGDIKDESKKDTRENSMEINLSNYNVEHVSMMSNPDLKKIASITMKLKNKHSKPEQTPGSLLRINFSDTIAEKLKDRKYLDENNIEAKIKVPSYETNMFKQFDLKPYSTSSDATSKDYRIVNTDQSLNLDIEKEKSQKFSNSVEPLRIENDIESCYVFSSLKCAFQGKKYDTADKMEQTHVNLNTGHVFPDELAMFEKAPKTIDEKFILLLLENVSLLSKNLPAIHKDINGFYLRLRKKFEKVIKNQDTSINIQGVGLLGKIYSDEFKSKSFNDTETQFEKSVYDKRNRDVAIETSSITSANKSDKALSTDMVTPEHVNIQTEEYDCGYFQKNYDEQNNFSGSVREIYNANTSRSPTISSISERKDDAIAMEKAISNQNWYRKICTKDCGISAIILDKDENSRNLRIKAKTVNNQLQFKIDKESTGKSLKSDKENSSKMKQDLIKQISMLPPSVKVSTQQTDECIRNNIDVFELFNSVKYSGKKSSSMIEINAENREMSDDLKTIYRCTSYPSYCSGLASPTGAVRTQAGFVSGTPGGRLAGWIIESGGPLESASRELGQAQLSVQQLQRLLDALELHQQTHHDTDVSLEGASPNVKKDRRKFGLRKKKSNSKCASVELQPPHIDPSASHMTLSALTAPPSPGGGASSIPNSAASLPIACAATRPQSLPGAEALGAAGPASLSSLTPDHQLREDFTVLAKDLVASLKAVVSTLVCERGRLRAAMEAAEAGGAAGGAVVAALRTNLSTALHQNSELRARLARIHDASDLADVSSLGRNSEPNRHIHQSLSYSSSCVSASEFFDAEEHEDDDLKPAEIIDADEAGVIELDGDSSSEAGSLSSEEGSASSDNSDAASIAVVGTEAHPLASGGGGGGGGGGGAGGGGWARRTGLPAPRPTPGGPSLWNLLYKNIGKDLSQVSMPVTINEPLNMLQRLCEELEYSELLDAAAACPNGIERMALVSAFAVSAYAAAAHRAASKPFNPLLAETYECVREDRGFRFIAEQVSHHPPISACHAESPRWVFWQEARIKTKFWGKSMEFQPAGRVHVRLLTTGDHYSWNKVTTCVHNLFGGQRWVDQYGDMLVVCHGTDIACKLNFIKASSWSSSRHEVRGAVSEGSTRLRLQGRWSEALHAGDPPAARCLWRPGAMPPEHEMYYGFTRFAMELNELEPGMRDVLPHTDTRLRPDQRALEEGDVDTAERLKHQLEQAQRERRRDRPDPAPVWFRKTIEGGEETWVFTGEYWRARDAGFPHNPAPRLW